MSNARQQQFIQTLIETGEKLSLEDFFKKILSSILTMISVL
jgi:hypothetical protein